MRKRTTVHYGTQGVGSTLLIKGPASQKQKDKKRKNGRDQRFFAFEFWSWTFIYSSILFLFQSFLVARCCVATVEKKNVRWLRRVGTVGVWTSSMGTFFSARHMQIAAILVGAIAVEMQQAGGISALTFWPVESIRVPRAPRGNTLRRAIGLQLVLFFFSLVLEWFMGFGYEYTSMTLGVFATLSCPLHMLRWKKNFPSPPCQIALISLPTPCPHGSKRRPRRVKIIDSDPLLSNSYNDQCVLGLLFLYKTPTAGYADRDLCNGNDVERSVPTRGKPS